MIKPFKRLRAKIDALSADEWNRVTKLIEGLSNLRVSPPLRMIQNPQGAVISVAPSGAGYFLGELVDDGPGAPGNYTDQRYWVKEQKITNSGEADTTDLTYADEDTDTALWITATNLAEVLSETHFLPDDDNFQVIVFRAWDQEPIARYYFYSLGDVELGVTDAHDMSPTPEGTETADTGTWARDNQPANKDGVDIKVHTRSVYNDAGNEILYGFWREFTFDATGRLVALSLETRYIVNTPDACP